MYTRLLPGLLLLTSGGALFWYAAGEFVVPVLLALVALQLIKYGLRLLPFGLFALIADR